jgi:hypothetical protein
VTTIGQIELELMRRWVQRMNTLVETVLESQTQCEALSVKKHLALVAAKQPLMLKHERELAGQVRFFDLAFGVLQDWSEEPTLSAANERLVDVHTRLNLAWECYSTWRKGLAQLEFLVASGAFASEDEQTEARQRVEQMERDFYQQVELGVALLPASAWED